MHLGTFSFENTSPGNVHKFSNENCGAMATVHFQYDLNHVAPAQHPHTPKPPAGPPPRMQGSSSSTKAPWRLGPHTPFVQRQKKLQQMHAANPGFLSAEINKQLEGERVSAKIKRLKGLSSQQVEDEDNKYYASLAQSHDDKPQPEQKETILTMSLEYVYVFRVFRIFRKF